MKRKRSSLGFAAFVSLILLAASVACAGQSAPGQTSSGAQPAAQTVEWGLQHERGPATYNAEALKAFAEKVGERTNGGFKISIYDSGGMNIPWAEALNTVSTGANPIIGTPTSYLAGTDPFFLAESLAGLITSIERHQTYTAAIHDLRAQVLSNHGVRELAHWSHDKQVWAANKPLQTADDFRGARLRVASADLSALVTALGGSPVTMPITDVYVAMQRGAMEGFNTGVGAMHGLSAWEVASHLTDLPVSQAGFIVIVNEDAYQALPESYRTVLQEEMRSLQERMYYLTKINEEKEVQFLVDQGMILVEPTPELVETVATQAASYWDRWAQEGGANTQEALRIARELGYAR